MSPTETIKQRSVGLMFDNINHNAMSQETKDKYAFCVKTKSLAILLERYTPKTAKEEIRSWYKQLATEVKEIKEGDKTSREKEVLELNAKYKYALEVDEHNMRILMNSPIVELEAEGELDASDLDLIHTVRGAVSIGGKRVDDGQIIFKR